jgi:hypothetical protein
MASVSMSLYSMMNDISIAGTSEYDKLSSIISRLGKSMVKSKYERN